MTFRAPLDILDKLGKIGGGHYCSICNTFKCKKKHKTHLVDWRGGNIEFAIGSEYEDIARPPWYVLLVYCHKNYRPWIYWLDYAGPPQVYLTKQAANGVAKELRKQYHCKVEIKEIGFIEPSRKD